MGKTSRSRKQTIVVRPSVLLLALLTALAANVFVESPLMGQVNGGSAAVCGNGSVEAGETCDDGNGKPGDGCSTACQAERCGDTIVNGGEECDTGGTDTVYPASGVPKAGCSARCVFTYCGDGSVQTLLGEECDDGNRTDGDACSSLCKNVNPATDFCNPPAIVVGSTWQNPLNPLNTDNNTVIDRNDALIIQSRLNQQGPGRLPAVRDSAQPYYDVNGDGSVTALDTLIIANHLNRQCPVTATPAAAPQQTGVAVSSAQSSVAADPDIRLSAVQLSCKNGIPTATVSYDKNFGTCAHLLHMDGTYAHPGNVFCAEGNTTIDVPLSAFRDLAAGQQVKLCHGNNYGICDTATVTGTADCAAASSVSGTAPAVKNGEADLSMTLAFRGSDGPDSFVADMTVFNEGTARATRVTAAMGRPASTRFIGAEGCRQYVANGAVYCDGIDLEPGASRTFSLVFQADHCPTAATVTAMVQSVDDGNPANNLVRFVNQQIECGTAASEPETEEIAHPGSLFVVADTEPVRQHQLLGGTLGDPVMRLSFRAQNESIEVTDLQLTSMRNTALSVDRLELFRAGETQPFATATVAACGSDQVPTTVNGVTVHTFCAKMVNRQLAVLQGQEIDVLVRPRIKTDENGAISGEDIQFYMASTPIADAQAGRGAVRARGMTSGQDLAANNGDSAASGEIFIGTNVAGPNQDITGGLNEVVLSKITSLTNAGTDADGTSVPSGAYPIGRFRFTAAANQNMKGGLNRIGLHAITFTVTAVNVDISQTAYMLYNAANPAVKIPCRVTSANSGNQVQTVRCPVSDTVAGILTTIESGGSATIILQGEIRNPRIASNTDSVLRVSLNPPMKPADTGATGWLWSDSDADTGSIGQSFDWFELDDTVINGTRYSSAAIPVAAIPPLRPAAPAPAPTPVDNSSCFRVTVQVRGNVTAGQTFQADVSFLNSGNQTWNGASGEYRVALTNPQDASVWGISGAPMGSFTVNPGQFNTFQIYPVHAPSTPGVYPFSWRMTKNGVPFGAVCQKTITVDPAPVPGSANDPNCAARSTALAQADLWGEQSPFRRTTDGSFMLYTETVNGVSKILKGIDMNTCESTTLVDAGESAFNDSIWESSIADDGTILYAVRGWYYQGGGPEDIRGKLILMNRATKAKAVIVPRAPGNGNGDRAMISRDGRSVVFTASHADLDTNPATSIRNTDGSRELFLWKNGIITQLTNFVGGTDQYTVMNAPMFADPAGRFIAISLDFDPVTLRRHERDISISDPVPSGTSLLWQTRLYLYDTQTGQFRRLTDTQVANPSDYRAVIDAAIAEITGRQSSSILGNLLISNARSALSLLGDILSGGVNLAGALMR